MGKWRALALVLVHVVFVVHFALWWRGGETLTPLEPSEAGETLLTGAVNAGFVLFALALALTLVVGRFFCGWACHVVAYQDLARWLLARLGLKPRPLRSRLLLLVPFYAAFSMFVWPSLQKYWLDSEALPTLSWHLSTSSFWERFPGPVGTLVTVVVCGGMVIWFLGAKGFCTYGCPYGAFFGLIGRHAPGRIRVSDACEGCGHCSAVCTSEVLVHAEVARFGQVVDPSCLRCLDCVSACPKEALSFGFLRDPKAKAKGRLGFWGRLVQPPKRSSHWDLSWGEETLAALIFGLAVWSLRGAYGLIPFLLAIGLALLIAFATVTFKRLVLQRDLTVQHSDLRRDGRLSPKGVATLIGVPLVLATVVHTAGVQTHAREGERLLIELGQTRDRQEYRALQENVLEHLETASRWGLVDTFKLENQLGQVLARAGRAEDARRHLERAVELKPESLSARVELAWVHARGGAPDRAAAVLEPLLELGEVDRSFLGSIEMMRQRYPGDPGLAALAQAARALLEARTQAGLELHSQN